jgi:hypothetical protein
MLENTSLKDARIRGRQVWYENYCRWVKFTDVAEQTSAVLLGSSVIFNIETTNEENISLDSYFGEEDEVILTPGTLWKFYC